MAGSLLVSNGTAQVSRDGTQDTADVSAPLPAVVSVTDRTGEARYPSFRAIMVGKKKPITTWTLADLGVDPTLVGRAGAASAVRSAAPQPPRQAGEIVVDEGEGATLIADFLVAQRLL